MNEPGSYTCEESCDGTQCGGSCVDLMSSQDNCGYCGHVCPGDLTCQGGMCLDQMCCSEIHACADHPMCPKLFKCLTDCPDNDKPCDDACSSEQPHDLHPLSSKNSFSKII